MRIKSNQHNSLNGVLYLTTTKYVLPPSAHSTNPLQTTTAIGSLLWNTFQNVPVMQTIPQKQGLSSVYAIRASDGRILWHYTLNNGKNSWASWLSVEHGVVYTSANSDITGVQGLGDIYALQSSNGSSYVLCMISSTGLLALHCSSMTPFISALPLVHPMAPSMRCMHMMVPCSGTIPFSGLCSPILVALLSISEQPMAWSMLYVLTMAGLCGIT